MAKPPDGAGPQQHPISGHGYELKDQRGQRWAHIFVGRMNNVSIGYPQGAHDSSHVVIVTVESGDAGPMLHTMIRAIDTKGYSSPGGDEERIAFAELADTARVVELSVPPDGPTWARLERKGTCYRLLQPSGELRAELTATPTGLDVTAFDAQGQTMSAQTYLMP